MTRTTKELRDEYKRMDQTWPRPLPAMTFAELKEAARRLTRKFRPSSPILRCAIVETKGCRHTRFAPGGIKINAARGIDDLVHVLSHRFAGGHHDGHLEREWEMIKYVKTETDWLAGGLASANKPKPDKPPLVERRAAKARRALQRATDDLKKAEKRVKRWTQTVRYYDREPATP